MSPPPPPNLKVLFFDTFGTTVAQRTPVADALFSAAQEALASENSSISDEVRRRAESMTYEQWFKLGGQWSADEDSYVKALKAQSSTVDWAAVDKHRVAALPKLLSAQGLIVVQASHSITTSTSSDTDTDTTIVPSPGSLFNAPQLAHLGTIWHRLPPWPDTIRGLILLNTKYTTAALSNTYSALLTSLVSYSNIPFGHTCSSDMFDSYKPNAKVYLGAADGLGAKPEECALVAAHLSDLQGAKACGFYTIYVQRELEEKNPDLIGTGIEDMSVGEYEGGFVTLAEKLGIGSTG